MSNGISCPPPPPSCVWHSLYYAALFETERDKIPDRIQAAEQAILARMRALFGCAEDHIEEDVILDDALYALRALRSSLRSEEAAA